MVLFGWLAFFVSLAVGLKFGGIWAFYGFVVLVSVLGVWWLFGAVLGLVGGVLVFLRSFGLGGLLV